MAGLVADIIGGMERLRILRLILADPAETRIEIRRSRRIH